MRSRACRPTDPHLQCLRPQDWASRSHGWAWLPAGHAELAGPFSGAFYLNVSDDRSPGATLHTRLPGRARSAAGHLIGLYLQCARCQH